MSSMQLNFLSVALFLVAFLSYRKTRPSLVHQSLFFLLTLALLVLLLTYQVADYFTGNGIDDAVLFHLKYGLDGAGFLDYAGLILIVVIALLLGMAILARFSFGKKISSPKPLKSRWIYLLLLLAFYCNAGVNDLYHLLNGGFRFQQEAQTSIDDADFSRFYHHPKKLQGTGNGKNLVFIYAESLERSYFNEELFPGLIKHLRQLESRSTYFTDIGSVAATGWTIAGMTASQCGVPLFTPSHGNAMSGMDSFMQSAVCLGDLLSEEGYHLSYLAGADLEFAGKGKLYTTHGFDEVSGKAELLQKIEDPSYASYWGLHDDSLLELVYQHFQQLSAKNERFGLFTLTLDTHHPEGHPVKSCGHIEYQDGANKMLNAVACADYLLAGFIERLLSSPYAGQTVIVLASDHLSMNNKAYHLLQQQKRTNLLMVFDPSNTAAGKQVDSKGSTLDIGTTLLPFLGYSADIGLGRNLLVQDEQQKNEISFIHENLKRWQRPIAALWSFPQIRQSLSIDLDARTVRIDQRVFRLPLLIELDDALNTILKFDFDRQAAVQKTLLQHRLAIAEDKYFILIDACENVSHFEHALGNEGFCLISGKGRRNLQFLQLGKNVKYTAEDIHDLVTPPRFNPQRIFSAGLPQGSDVSPLLDMSLLQEQARQGFRYFEIQFAQADNGQWYCVADKQFALPAGIGPVQNSCSIESLGLWLKDNPAIYIVTDFSGDSDGSFQAVLDGLPDVRAQIIPQISNPYDFYQLRENNIEAFIWVLDDYQGTDDSIAEWLVQFDRAFAVAVPAARAETGLSGRLGQQGVALYMRDINSAKELGRIQHDWAVTEIYTRGLLPGRGM